LFLKSDKIEFKKKNLKTLREELLKFQKQFKKLIKTLKKSKKLRK